jgi:hypothetical protein
VTDATDYAATHGLDTLLGDTPTSARTDAFAAVDPEMTTPHAPDWDDLVRLHRLVRERRVTTVLEFGCGYSTIVMAAALRANREEAGSYVTDNLRRSNAFEIHAVDDMPAYIESTRARVRGAGLYHHVHLSTSEVYMDSWHGRVCTAYDVLPNVCPDLIYLDGPSQHSVTGDRNGIHTRHPDRLPMSCDILKIEHFLLPGCLIVVDGRTANARFLKCNLQRQWAYTHDSDVHTFELVEPPLGPLNEKQIRYCLGDAWLEGCT